MRGTRTLKHPVRAASPGPRQRFAAEARFPRRVHRSELACDGTRRPPLAVFSALAALGPLLSEKSCGSQTIRCARMLRRSSAGVARRGQRADVLTVTVGELGDTRPNVCAAPTGQQASCGAVSETTAPLTTPSLPIMTNGSIFEDGAYSGGTARERRPRYDLVPASCDALAASSGRSRLSRI